MTNFVRTVLLALPLASLSVVSARAQQPADSTNRELAALVQQDQTEARALVKPGGREEDLRAWVIAGAPRREMVRRLIRSGGLMTAQDYANASLLLQHGDSPEDFARRNPAHVTRQRPAGVMRTARDVAPRKRPLRSVDYRHRAINPDRRTAAQGHQCRPLRLHTAAGRLADD